MTLILAACENGKIVIGADSRGSSHHAYHDGETKIIRVANYYVGVAGSVRVAQILRYNRKKFKDIERPTDVFRFGKKLKALLDADQSKSLTLISDQPSFEMLLATRCGIFDYFSNGQFHRRERWAVGSGDMVGIGFFDGSPIKETSKRIEAAIKNAARVVPSVGGEPVIKQL